VSKVAVLGSGAWGTTLAQALVDAGNECIIWGRNEQTVSEISTSHTNNKFLPGITLPDALTATSNIHKAIDEADQLVLAIPAQGLRENLEGWKSFYPTDIPTISTLKGIEADTHLRMTEVVQEVLTIESDQLGLITGPNLAGELSLRQPAGAVGASTNEALAQKIVELFSTPYFRIYPSTDLVGCELAGATKSVIALAVGMAVGLGYGGNTQAMIITRGLSEVARFGESYGSQHITFLGLAGVGDLVVSCGSGLSRNRSFGEVLGSTGSFDIAREQISKTVEGVASAPAILELAHRVGVEVPIIEVVCDVINNVITPAQGIERMMKVSYAAELMQ
jgi:glycerol-3-phosphate dehydrogenase (NAD(P)+)